MASEEYSFGSIDEDCRTGWVEYRRSRIAGTIGGPASRLILPVYDKRLTGR